MRKGFVKDKYRVLKRTLDASSALLEGSTSRWLCLLLVCSRLMDRQCSRESFSPIARQSSSPIARQCITLSSSNLNLKDHLLALIDKVGAAIAPSTMQLLETSIETTEAATLHGILTQLQAPGLDDLWNDWSTLGFAYEFLGRSNRRAAQDAVQKPDKSLDTPGLIAFTQLHTPTWIVDYLIANTVLPIWSSPYDNDEKNATFRELNVWIDLNKRSTRNLKAIPANCIRLLDPCCGAGNFLFRAFDLFVAMHLSEGKDLHDAIAQTMGTNIGGADIDEDALEICKLGLAFKCLALGSKPEKQFLSIQSSRPAGLLGSLSVEWHGRTNHPLGTTYNAIVTNPPYSGRRLIDRQLKHALRQLFPSNHHDLASAFLEWSLQKLEPSGRVGFITQASLLSLPSYSYLRERLLKDFRIDSVVDLGAGVFPLQGGDKVNSMLVVVSNDPLSRDTTKSGNGNESDESARLDQHCIRFFDLTSEQEKSASALSRIINADEPQSGKMYVRKPAEFLINERFSLTYSCPSHVNHIIATARNLSQVADVRQGLATTDNGRFVRFMWDVPDQSGWVPYVKGAGSDSWYSPVKHSVRWGACGEEIKEAVSKAYPYLKGNYAWVVKNEQYYFREGLCFSFVNAGNLAVRHLPPGCIFDVGASSLFCKSELEQWFLLGYLNSHFVKTCALHLNPTINFQVGDIKRLPMLEIKDFHQREIAELAQEIFSIIRALHLNFDPVTAFFDPHVSSTEHNGFFAVDVDRPNASGPDRVLLSLNSYLTSQVKRLSALQNQIERVVDAYTSTHRREDDAGTVAQSKLASHDTPTLVVKAQEQIGSPSAFARAYIMARVLGVMREPACDGFACMPLNDRDIGWRLKISQPDTAWLTAALGQSLTSYMVRDFTNDAARQFLGSTPVIAIEGPQINVRSANGEERCLVLTTTSFIRKLLADRCQSASATNAESGHLYPVLRTVFGANCSPAARGSELQRAIALWQTSGVS